MSKMFLIEQIDYGENIEADRMVYLADLFISETKQKFEWILNKRCL